MLKFNLMVAIALLGLFQQEVAPDQMRRLFATIKKQTGDACLLFCNAEGLFARSKQLYSQLDILFNNGIEVVFCGASSFARNVNRTVFEQSPWPLLRPLNMSDQTLGKGKKLFKINENFKVWLINVSNSSNTSAIGLPFLCLEEFFDNKTDNYPVLISMDGKNLDEKYSLAINYSNKPFPIYWFCTGTEHQTHKCELIDKTFFQADTGKIAHQKTIAGEDSQNWITGKIKKTPILATSITTPMVADYTLVWLNEQGIPTKCSQHEITL